MDGTRLATINEHRQAAVMQDLAAETVTIADGIAAFSPGVAWINHATLVGLGTDVPDAELDRLEAFYRERGVPSKIELTILATEPFLAQLAARGYCTEHYETVFARDLTPGEDPFAAIPHKLPAGLEIVRTDPADDAACREHAILVNKGFIPDPIPEEHIQIAMRAIQHPRSAAFLARLDGQAVGACGMEVFEHDGERLCSLWGTTVLEPYRRRGIQLALIAKRLAHGLDQGCRAAVIESLPGIPTERNAARLGFGLSYVRVSMAQAAG